MQLAGTTHAGAMPRPYTALCNFLFGRTISVWAAEKPVFAALINWLLRDPLHCQKELEDAENGD